MLIQTNRTLLLEEINAGKPSLLTLIGEVRNKKGLDDEHIEEINRALEVHSFAEFIQKLKPVCYIWTDEEGERFGCSGEYPHSAYNAAMIHIDEGFPFFRTLLRRKKAKDSGEALSERWEDLPEQILPDSITRELAIRKKKLQDMVREADLSGREPDRKEMERILKELADYYRNPLLKTWLFTREMQKKAGSRRAAGKRPPGIHGLGKDLQVKVLEDGSSPGGKAGRLHPGEYNKYAELIEELCGDIRLRFLLLEELPVEEKLLSPLTDLYNQDLQRAGEMMEQLLATVRPIIETVFGVYTFFEQYRTKESRLPPVLLIANFPRELLQKPENRERLSTYLRTVNFMNDYRNTIWYAVLPRVTCSENKAGRLTRVRFPSSAAEEGKCMGQSQNEDLGAVMRLLEECRIQAFLSLKADESTHFMGLKRKGLGLWNGFEAQLREAGGGDYVTPCYPNFIIIPRSQAKIQLGCLITRSREGSYYGKSQGEADSILHGMWEWEKAHPVRAVCDGIYVEASYVAAGLFAACQCPGYLAEHVGGRIEADYPGVHYQPANPQYRELTPSTMSREIFGYPHKLLEDIQEKASGVVFGPGKQVVMLTDRTLNSTREGHITVSIVQTATYIERVVRYQTRDFKADLLKQAFDSNPGHLKMQWYSHNKGVNSILKEEDQIEYELDEKHNRCILKLEFGSMTILRSIPVEAIPKLDKAVRKKSKEWSTNE